MSYQTVYLSRALPQAGEFENVGVDHIWAVAVGDPHDVECWAEQTKLSEGKVSREDECLQVAAVPVSSSRCKHLDPEPCHIMTEARLCTVVSLLPHHIKLILLICALKEGQASGPDPKAAADQSSG